VPLVARSLPAGPAGERSSSRVSSSAIRIDQRDLDDAAQGGAVAERGGPIKRSVAEPRIIERKLLEHRHLDLVLRLGDRRELGELGLQLGGEPDQLQAGAALLVDIHHARRDHDLVIDTAHHEVALLCELEHTIRDEHAAGGEIARELSIARELDDDRRATHPPILRRPVRRGYSLRVSDSATCTAGPSGASWRYRYARGATPIVDLVEAQDADAEPQHGAVLLAAGEPANVRVERLQGLGILRELYMPDHGDAVERLRRLIARLVRGDVEVPGDRARRVGLADVERGLDVLRADRALEVDVRIVRPLPRVWPHRLAGPRRHGRDPGRLCARGAGGFGHRRLVLVQNLRCRVLVQDLGCLVVVRGFLRLAEPGRRTALREHRGRAAIAVAAAGHRWVRERNALAVALAARDEPVCVCQSAPAATRVSC